MILKSKQYSRALAGWFLAFFLLNFYTVYVLLWKESVVDEKLSYGELLKELYTAEYSKKSMYIVTVMLVALLVLAIAMFANNRALFFFGILLDTAGFGYSFWLWIDALKDAKDVEWDTDFTLKFITKYVIIALVYLFLILMALSLLAGASATKAFAVLVMVLATVELLLVLAHDILPYVIDDWEDYRASGNIYNLASTDSTDTAFTAMGDIPRYIIAILAGKWAITRVKEVAAAKAPAQPGVAPNAQQNINPYSNAGANPYTAVTGYANPTMQVGPSGIPAAPVAAPVAPAAPAAAVYQPPVPETPAAPAYQTPETPAAPAYQAPEAPAAPVYTAPEAPVYTAPEAPVYAAPEAPVYKAPEAPAYTAPEAAAVEDYASLAGDAADSAEAVADSVTNAAEEYSAWTGEAISNTAEAATETVSNYAETAADTAGNYAEAAADTVTGYADAAVDTAADAAQGFAETVTETAENAVGEAVDETLRQ